MKRLLVTGHKGYIGTHLVALLKEQGYWVTGCDLNLFEGCEWEENVKPDEELETNFLKLTDSDLENFDGIIHLAAISNDPMGDLDPAITYQINWHGTASLAKKAKQAGIPRFLFASSCSIYGSSNDKEIDENDPVQPLSAYAESKINAEIEIHALADSSFSPISLRNATAYGNSPMLRIDLVANNLLGCALSRGEIRVMSDGSPWRPLIHCRDIARAFIAFMEAPREVVHNQVVNVGSNRENYQVKEILDKVKELVPTASITFTGEVGKDPRNYRVNFNRLQTLLPHFHCEYTLSKGMKELYAKYIEKKFCLSDFEGDKFIRLRTLKKRLDQFQIGQPS